MPPSGIRTHNLSRQAAAGQRHRPRGHWDRQITTLVFAEYSIQQLNSDDGTHVPKHVGAVEDHTSRCACNLCITLVLYVNNPNSLFEQELSGYTTQTFPCGVHKENKQT